MLTINKIKQSNKIKYNKTHTNFLYSEYDFDAVNVRQLGEILISEEDVDNFYEELFDKIQPVVSKRILELSEKCDIDKYKIGNFTISNDGVITLGYKMAAIKGDLESYQTEWNNYVDQQSRTCYKKINIEFKGE